MTTQPEALRLADRLESDFIRSQTMVDAAAELRRLSAVEAQRDALLEALKYHQEQTRPIQKSIDAIQAAEENT